MLAALYGQSMRCVIVISKILTKIIMTHIFFFYNREALINHWDPPPFKIHALLPFINVMCMRE